ncbi:MAG TPA: putative Ig domain-containing protein [Nitrospiria bacterium]|nr:putative Ig domain-containing protein [Nitrospiria bacterium]
MKTVTIDKEAELTPRQAGTKRSSGASSPGGLRRRRFLVALLLIGAVFAMKWMVSQLTTGDPKSLTPSSAPSEASPVAAPAQETGSVTSSATRPAPSVNNYPPKILSIEILPQKPHLGEELEARAEAFDPEGDPVQLSYTWVVNGQIVTKGSSPRFATADLHKHDRVVVRVVPSDAKSDGVEGSSQPVFIANRPPEITSSPSTTVAGGIYTYNVKATDADGDPLQFRLSQAPEGMTIEPATGVIQWKVSTEHPLVDIGVVASDGDGGEAFQQFKLTVGAGS